MLHPQVRMRSAALLCAAITRLGSRCRRLIKIESKCVSGGVPHRAPLSLLNEAPFAGSGGRGNRDGGVQTSAPRPPRGVTPLPDSAAFPFQPLNTNARARPAKFRAPEDERRATP